MPGNQQRVETGSHTRGIMEVRLSAEIATRVHLQHASSQNGLQRKSGNIPFRRGVLALRTIWSVVGSNHTCGGTGKHVSGSVLVT
jgi:hypothetical protein